MKNKNIQTKRGTGKQSSFRALYAKTRGRKKQRAATMVGSAENLGADVPNVGIGRALIVILVLHIVAIGAVYLHSEWIKDNPSTFESTKAVTPAVEDISEKIISPQKEVQPVVKEAERTPLVATPESEPVVEEVVENNGILPSYATQPREEAITPVTNPLNEEPSQAAVRATPNTVHAASTVEYINYTVQKGDSVWRITNRTGMSADEFCKLNGIKNNVIKIGQVVKVKK